MRNQRVTGLNNDGNLVKNKVWLTWLTRLCFKTKFSIVIQEAPYVNTQQ